MEMIDRYYGTVYRLSSLIGTWPYLKPRTRIFRLSLITMTTITVCVPQIANLALICNTNLQCVCRTLASFLLSVAGAVKVYTFPLNTSRIKLLIQHLSSDWEELKTPEEYKITRLYAENSKRFSSIYSVYCFSSMILFLSMSFIPYVLDIVAPLNETRPILMPYPGYYFVNTREYFFQIYWHSLVAWEIVVIGIVAHDCMFVTFVEHICGIFAVIGFRFKHLFSPANDAIAVANPYSDYVYRKRIAFFLDTHQKALELAQLLEDSFTISYAIQMSIVTIGISITLLQVSQRIDDVLEIIKYVSYVLAQLAHLFILSFEGQKLIDHSAQMRNNIYNSSWYEVSVKSQKLIIMVIIKSFRPSFISAGKIYIFSLENFITVLQASMSYFTVLSSF